MATYRKPFTRQQLTDWGKQMLFLASKDACETFDAISPVKRVEMKMNHHVVGQFLLLAILANGNCHEGEIVQAERRFAWCLTPDCTCKGYDRAISPILFGATIED